MCPLPNLSLGRELGTNMSPKRSAPTDAPSGSSTPPSGPLPAARQRVPRPKIDLDESIRLAKERVECAKKAISEARTQARNDRRKKARLVKKASALSDADLDRIKVLKRCGLSLPHDDEPDCRRSAASGSGSAGSAAAPAAQERDEEPAEPTEDEADDQSNGEDDRNADDRARKQATADGQAVIGNA